MKIRMNQLGAGLLSLTFVASAFAADKPAAKGGDYSVKLASVTPVAGYEEASFGGSLIFTAANASLGAGEIVAATANTQNVVLTLTAQGASTAANLVRQNAGQRLAVLNNGRVVAAPVIEPGMIKGTTLTASTAPIAPAGPTLSVVASTEAPKGMHAFDVFLTGAMDLRGYQVALSADGGTNGKLNLVDIHQDATRADFVFGSEQIVNAVDLNGGRVVGALFVGSVDAATPKYLGTFTYQPSSDATGTFTVKVQVSEETMLRDSTNSPIGYQAGAAGTVQIGTK
jgi:hypothetical protein